MEYMEDIPSLKSLNEETDFVEEPKKPSRIMGIQEVLPGECFFEPPCRQEDMEQMQEGETIKSDTETGKTGRKGREKHKKECKQERPSQLSVTEDALLEDVAIIKDKQKNVYVYEQGSYKPQDKITLAETVKRNLPSSYWKQISDPYFYNRLLMDFKSDPRIKTIDRKRLDCREKYLVAFQNGIYDCMVDEFVDFSPDYMIFSKLKARYKANSRCPAFDDFLYCISGGDEDITTLIWEMIAYILLPNNDGKCFFVMGTAPNSGKSLLAKVIESMFSDSLVNRSTISSISGRFAMASMSGKRINIAPECVDERISPDVVNNIKLLTGEEAVNVERKGEDAVMEQMTCKLLLATNCAAAFAVKDQAFWNRMRVIPFLHSIPQEEQRTDLFYELMEEIDDIASYAVSEYAYLLIASKYQFTIPDAARKLMSQWRNSRLDNLKEFLEQQCVITYDKSDFLAVGELYNAYCEWMKRFYSEVEPFALRDFGRKIRENFIQCMEPREKEKINGKYVRVLHGICWADDYNG